MTSLHVNHSYHADEARQDPLCPVGNALERPARRSEKLLGYVGPNAYHSESKAGSSGYRFEQVLKFESATSLIRVHASEVIGTDTVPESPGI